MFMQINVNLWELTDQNTPVFIDSQSGIMWAIIYARVKCNRSIFKIMLRVLSWNDMGHDQSRVFLLTFLSIWMTSNVQDAYELFK